MGLIGNWFVDLALVRTAIGSEFRFGEEKGVYHFGVYGHFDCALFSIHDYLRDMQREIVGSDLREFVLRRFFPYYPNDTNPNEYQKRFTDLVDNIWDYVVVVLVKFENLGFPQAVDSFMKDLDTDAFVFIGSGYADMVLIQGGHADSGNTLSTLLTSTTQFRETSATKMINTTSYPMISYQNIYKNKAFVKLKGTVKPTISIQCMPACENKVCKSIDDAGFPSDYQINHIYGTSDLSISWPMDIDFHKFAQALTAWRNPANTFVINSVTTLQSSIRKSAYN